ncbi:hypothetical protein PSTG_16735 [Puccinia striiformis f. sp. tritici PST-78]|uniref:Uncharacterized protein n=1 Tax=Puccinia striiformis f. sp. tritici PST-78 TaxID=1165861 RepID=A0A0L0USS0_9BASI|nr:hypothetical protein PSTG_16735 [Puccinia striiformis f. sp. tritici PST-78]
MKGLDRVASNGSDEKQRWDMKQILNAGGPCPHDVSSYRGLPNKITLRDGSSSLLPIIHSPSHISLPTRPGHSALDPTHVTGDKSTVNLGSGDQRLGSHYHVVPKWERSVHRLLGLSQPAPSTTPPPIVACYGHHPFPAAGVKVTGSYNPLPPQSMLGSGMWADQRRFRGATVVKSFLCVLRELRITSVGLTSGDKKGPTYAVKTPTAQSNGQARAPTRVVRPNDRANNSGNPNVDVRDKRVGRPPKPPIKDLVLVTLIRVMSNIRG